MKNKQKGFIFPLLIVLVAALLFGGGVYFYNKNKKFEVSEITTFIATSTINTNLIETIKSNTKGNTYIDKNLVTNFLILRNLH